MGMSTHVVGFKPADAKWQKMKAVWDACDEAGTDVPSEVVKFFGGDIPDKSGVEVGSRELKAAGAVTEWDNGDSMSGYEIHLDRVPADVKIIRVYNSF